ncbi:MAG TPA: thioredoxin domain-containing protein [Allosphingosinicella sp.]|nr:thioredoxin domain-containing protein [Allosphingosinicella sp.]
MMMMTSQPSAREHILGDAKGRVVLVQYGDYQCHRSAAAQQLVAAVLPRYPAGLLFTFRHFPRADRHPMAMLAAETAEYAAMHECFWPMHAALMANAHRMSLGLLFALGRQFGLQESRLRDALAIGLCAGRVQRDVVRAVLDEVEDTPAFFIDGRRIRSPDDESALNAAIEAALRLASRPRLHLKVDSEER